MKPTILVSGHLTDDILSLLAQECDVRANREDRPMGRADLLEAVAGADGFLSMIIDRKPSAPATASSRSARPMGRSSLLARTSHSCASSERISSVRCPETRIVGFMGCALSECSRRSDRSKKIPLDPPFAEGMARRGFPFCRGKPLRQDARQAVFFEGTRDGSQR